MDASSEQLEIESLCQLFGRILNQAQLEATQAKLGLQRNRSVFTPAVVVWLMMFQRLYPNPKYRTKVVGIGKSQTGWTGMD